MRSTDNTVKGGEPGTGSICDLEERRIQAASAT